MIPCTEPPPCKERIEQLSVYKFSTLLTISSYCNRGEIINKIRYLNHSFLYRQDFVEVEVAKYI